MRHEIQTPNTESHVSKHLLWAKHCAKAFSALSYSCLTITLQSRQFKASLQMRKQTKRER